jgi:hypothetical protein
MDLVAADPDGGSYLLIDAQSQTRIADGGKVGSRQRVYAARIAEGLKRGQVRGPFA